MPTIPCFPTIGRCGSQVGCLSPSSYSNSSVDAVAAYDRERERVVLVSHTNRNRGDGDNTTRGIIAITRIDNLPIAADRSCCIMGMVLTTRSSSSSSSSSCWD